MRRFRLRRGVTLIELVVVVGVIGTLLSLLLVAVMRAREAAAIAQSKNNVRQIILGVHHYAAGHQDRLPPLGFGDTRLINGTYYPGLEAPPLFVQLLPYVECAAGNQRAAGRRPTFRPVQLFLSPADPTARGGVSKREANSSYAANAQVFRPHNARVAATFADGVSNTIAFAEHYASDCNGYSFPYWENGDFIPHRPSFADVIDVVPVVQGNPPVTAPSRRPTSPVATFQVAPRPSECARGVAQTPHPSGMIVGIADGGVRQLAPDISIATYWGAVTPRSGDLLAADW